MRLQGGPLQVGFQAVAVEVLVNAAGDPVEDEVAVGIRQELDQAVPGEGGAPPAEVPAVFW
jgi:hypothetical protein